MAQDRENPPIGVMGIEGRNGSDPVFMIPDRQCLEAFNIDWYASSLGRKRGGASKLSVSSSGTAFSGGAVSLARHVPGDDQTAAEFWSLDGAQKFHRLAGSVTWADPTVLDACSGNPQEAAFQSFNGKLYIAYKTAHNRMHVWDGSTLRRTSLDLPAVVTGFVLAAGTINDTRKYRIAWTKQVGGVTVLRSNLSVPSAQQVLAAQQVTVTRTAAPGEGETHWELYGASTSSSFGDYRLIATTVIGTTTAVDNAALPSTVSPADGANTPIPSGRYLAADDARVIVAGAYEVAANAENAMVPKNNRVWWTSVLGASDVGDDERISNTGTINSYADVEEAITGISQPLQVTTSASNSLERGSFYVFSFDSQWKFIQTSTASAPYLKFRITGGGGCVHHKSIITAIDVNGNPAIYWWSRTGPLRIGTNGQEFLGEDLLDIIPLINLDATIPVHSVYHAELRQVWFYLALSGSLYPNYRVVFDTRLGRVTEADGVRSGWSVASGESTKAYCSCMFSDTVAASMGRDLKPYIGYTGATEIWKCDTTDADDAGTPFQAYIDTKSYAPWGLGSKGGYQREPILIANPSDGVVISLITYRDEGAESSPSTADLTDKSDSGAALKVFTKFDSAKLADSFSFRARIGDIQATTSTWNLDGLIVPVSYQGEY